jgi:hypothetical protein
MVAGAWHIRCSNEQRRKKMEGEGMKRLVLLIALASLTQWGCQFLGGAAVGGLATGAGYEIQAKRQMDRLEDDYKSRRISREEYETRKRQIESGSILY